MRRIYVAEDQPALAELVRTALGTRQQFELTLFNNGLDLYRAVLERSPDLLILDILLPLLHGLAVARLLKFHDDYSHLPIVIMSSITDPDIEERALQAGADVFLPKPFEMAKLLEHVNRLLGEQIPAG